MDQRIGCKGEAQQQITFSVIVRSIGKPLDHVLLSVSSLLRAEKWESDLDAEKEKNVVAP
jgi:hypothetical protein